MLTGSTGKMVFRPFMDTPEQAHVSRKLRLLRHPLFAWTGLRPVIAQHTNAEHEALQDCARGCRSVVEIGVAEGASALAFREAMAADGTLYLIDPFHLSRLRWINCQKRAAKAAVSQCPSANVVWIEKFSFDASRTWTTAIDFLFIDGDHTAEGVMRDWKEWSHFVKRGGRVAFHDARIFESGWPKELDGPVKAVNELFRRGGTAGWKLIQEVHSLVVVERT